MIIHGPSTEKGIEIVVFQWSTQWGQCYECGLPAAFWLPGVSTMDYRDKFGVAPVQKRCAVCAANAAVDGERVARIEEDSDA